MKTITAKIRAEKRALAEARQAASAAQSLTDKVKRAGAKELEKLISQHGSVEIARIQSII